MSTTVTIAVPAPNHLPCDVTVQYWDDHKKSWITNVQESKQLKVGEATNVCIYKDKRILVEEIKETR